MNSPLEAFVASVLRLRLLMADADPAQWQAGQSPVPREDTTERSKGMTSDPTPTITGDARRLKLRIAVIEAEAAVEKAQKVVTAAEAHLTKALTEWQG